MAKEERRKKMKELKELITRAKEKDVKAMETLFIRFRPLLKSRAKRYSKFGLEYDDIFQQVALLFIIAVYDYKERPPYYLCRLYEEKDRLGIVGLLSRIYKANNRDFLWPKTKKIIKVIATEGSVAIP